MAVQAPFYMYAGPAFPTPEALLACRAVKRLAPLEEPMAQFYSEIGLYQQLVNHPRRVLNPDKAELFCKTRLSQMCSAFPLVVPLLHLSIAACDCPREFPFQMCLSYLTSIPTPAGATARATARAWPRWLPCCAPRRTGSVGTALTTSGRAHAS